MIIATGVGVVSWVLLIAPYAHDATLTLQTRLTSVAYPIADLLVFCVVVRLAMGAGRRGAAFYLLVGGTGALLLTDTIFAWKLLHGGYTPGGLLDPGWIVFYATWGAAALHPSMTSLSHEAPEPAWNLTRPRLALLAGATLIAPAVLIVRLSQGDTADAVVIAGASIMLFALVVARMVGLVQHNEQTARREKALREAGITLVSATTRDEIHAASLDAVLALAGDVLLRCLYVVGDAPGEFGLVAKATTNPATPPATRFGVGELPDDVRARLLAGSSSALDGADLAACCFGGAGAFADASAWLVPLFMRQQLRGVLVIVHDAPLGRPPRDALDGLATEVALRRERRIDGGPGAQRERCAVPLAVPALQRRRIGPSTGRDDHVRQPFHRAALRLRTSALEGTRFTNLVHADDVGRLRAFLAAVVGKSTGDSSLIELRMRRCDGAWLHVETLATNLLDNATIGGIVLTHAT